MFSRVQNVGESFYQSGFHVQFAIWIWHFWFQPQCLRGWQRRWGMESVCVIHQWSMEEELWFRWELFWWYIHNSECISCSVRIIWPRSVLMCGIKWSGLHNHKISLFGWAKLQKTEKQLSTAQYGICGNSQYQWKNLPADNHEVGWENAECAQTLLRVGM